MAAAPAAVVVLAVAGAFGPPPEVVLAGVNLGPNVGHAILHSGTIGAAVTAGDNGLRAMAVSLNALSAVEATAGRSEAADTTAWIESRHWQTAALFTEQLLPVLDTAPERTVLNLNVPDRPASDVPPLKRAVLAPYGETRLRIIWDDDGFVRVAAEPNGARVAPDTDIALLGTGHATVTPIQPVHEAAVLTLPV